jgi:hypothetical protein
MSLVAPLLRFEPKPQTDEYIITNRHIICRFKYIACCFDGGEPSDDGKSPVENKGLITMDYERFKELMTEQNIEIDSSKSWGQMSDVLDQLKTWHPHITRVVVDTQNPYPIVNLKDYPFNNQDYIQSLRYNTCLRSETDFQVFREKHQIVVDIKVYFKLVKKITSIEKYDVNLRYCQHLLSDSIKTWNATNVPYLDEISVKPSQLPFTETTSSQLCYVYPYLHLVPLWG